MGGGLESRCVGRVYGADGAVARHIVQLTHHLPTGFDNLTAATAQYQHVAKTLSSRQLLMMGT